MEGYEQVYNYEAILVANWDQLLDKVDVKNTLLLDKMLSKGAMEAGDVHEIRDEKHTSRKQIRLVLEWVRQKGWDVFKKFKASLKETGQESIVQRFLVPGKDLPDGVHLPAPPDGINDRGGGDSPSLLPENQPVPEQEIDNGTTDQQDGSQSRHKEDTEVRHRNLEVHNSRDTTEKADQAKREQQKTKKFPTVRQTLIGFGLSACVLGYLVYRYYIV